MKRTTIGILGGGQLGAMLVRSAIDFGIRVKVLDAAKDASTARYTETFHQGSPQSYDDVMAFGKDLSYLTIEMEAVNTDALKALRDSGVKVCPSPELIATIQDKYLQKQMLLEKGIPVVPGILIANKAALSQHSNKLPGCLKKCRDGYDGYGVMMLRTPADIENAFDAPAVLEEIVPIKQELSVLIARDEAGNMACYDPVLMVFDSEKFILDYQLSPAPIDAELSNKAMDLAKQVAEGIELVGLMAVEMFVTTDGQLLVNELAPRPHNSGHNTIEAATTSQYEQLIRVLCGMPLGDPSLTSPSVMLNLLHNHTANDDGSLPYLDQLLAMPGVHLHWYGKETAREGRKMGHLTITGSTLEEAMEKAKSIKNLQAGTTL